MYPNKTIDHFNPANWFPNYEPESDRRAVPVTFFVGKGSTGAEEALPVYMYAAEDAHCDPWRTLNGFDRWTTPTESGSIIMEFGSAGERTVFPDHLVYIREADFRANAERAQASLVEAFDELFEIMQQGVLTRGEFDERANFLRDMRTKWASVGVGS